MKLNLFKKAIIRIIGLISIALLFASCISDCEDNTEPTAKIVFIGHSYQYAKGLHSDEPINNQMYDGGYPISLVSDTTSYVFFDSTSTDTLSFRYKRKFSFESTDCGFIVKLNDFQMIRPTSFDSVTFNISQWTYDFPFKLRKNEYFIEVYN